MATVKEDYVSFETAKLLKEKGFNISLDSKNWICCMYDENGNIHWGIYDKNWYFRITHQMAMKWLREVHGLFISIGNEGFDYNWQVFDVKNRTKVSDVICLTRKYESACELALKYCLKNLI